MIPCTAFLGSALLLALVACATPTQPGPLSGSPAGPSSAPSQDSRVPEEIRVRNPKDARGIPYCQLLTRSQLLALGMLPDTATEGLRQSNVGDCGWDLADDPDNAGGITVRVDSANPALRGLYIIHSGRPYDFFEPTEVAGHPAVAVRISPDAGCTMEVAIADDQLLSAGANVVSRAMPDDCERARRIAEAVLANLPPRTQR